MLVSRAQTRLTRRGRLLRVVSEHYLRDDIPCRCPLCPTCPSAAENTLLAADTAGLADKFTTLKAKPTASELQLSAEPRNGMYLVLDSSVIIRQIDALENGAGLFDDCIVTQTSMNEVKTQNLKIYGRLLALMHDASRRIVPFSNEHHRETFEGRKPEQTSQQYTHHLVMKAASWLAAHLEHTGIGIRVIIDTPVVEKQGLDVQTTEAFVAAAGKTFADLLEMVAALPTEGELSGAGARASAVKVFRDHWSSTRITAALKNRTAFQGTMRITRDCWFEARVSVHGVSGKSDRESRDFSGGDDMVSVLVLGTRNMNRAFDGDLVVIELLPLAHWRVPTTRLTVKRGASADEDDQEESRVLGKLEEAYEGEEPASADDLRQSLRRIAAAKASGVMSSHPVPTGRVVGIIRRNWRQYCGSIEDEETSVGPQDGGSTSSRVLFTPVDARIPRIRLETRQRSSLLEKRFIIAVDGWEVTSRYAHGHYVRTLGAIGDKKTETDVILFEHDIPCKPFSADVIACLPPASWVINKENSGGRVDLRDLDVCSVDPPGCKDIDDALHARWLPDGTIEVGVHIADVSYFVKQGTAIDLEAAQRANTTYLVERRLDMLPGLLTETLCSLKSGVDRFSFSVTWIFRPKSASIAPGAVLATTSKSSPGICGADEWEYVPGSAKFFKSIIHSRASLTYQMAQTKLDDAGDTTAVGQGIKLLASVARCLRAKRKADGALTLASAEVKFMLDSETHEPLDVTAYEMRETNSMVEEFMLLANIYVAQRIVDSYPRYSVLRRHPAPPKRQYDSLLSAAAAVGVSIDVSSSKALADSLDAAVVSGNPYFNRLLRILATRCMMQANYFCSGQFTPAEYAHYGLATPIYTHFTSPIRRYADVIVHRQLAAAVGIEPLPTAYEDRQSMKVICDNMNRRHLLAQLAGRASGALHTNIFFKNRVVIESALVMRVKNNGIVLLIPRFGLEYTVLLKHDEATASKHTSAVARKPRNWKEWVVFTGGENRDLIHDEAQQSLTDAKDASLSARVFDEVRAAIFVVDVGRRAQELVVRVIEPPFHPGMMDVLPHGVTVDDATKGRALARNNIVAPSKLIGALEDVGMEEESPLEKVSEAPETPAKPSAAGTSLSSDGIAKPSVGVPTEASVATGSKRPRVTGGETLPVTATMEDRKPKKARR
jgi:exosome complex exonuclease DIS3/RRP44